MTVGSSRANNPPDVWNRLARRSADRARLLDGPCGIITRMTGDPGRRRWNRLSLALLIASTGVWMACAAMFFLLQAGDLLGVCDALGGSNNIGQSRYQVWPPGRECTFTPEDLPPIDLTTGQPQSLVIPVSPYGGLAAVSLVAFPVAVVSALTLRRRDPSAN